jgi:hypothetical protein
MPVFMKNKRKPIRLKSTNKKNERVTFYLYLVTGIDVEESIIFIRPVPAENKSEAITVALYRENKERCYYEQLQRTELNYSVKKTYADLGHDSDFYIS